MFISLHSTRVCVQVALPWMQLGFVGLLEVDQVLQLWDRVFGYMDATLLALLAAAIFVFRAVPLFQCNSAGEALVRMSSTQAVDVTLGTGVVQGLHLSPLASALQRPVLADVTGRGFAQATLTNVGRATSIATWSLIRQGRVVSTGSTQVTAGASVSLGQLLGGRDHLRGATLVISGTSATWSVSATLETSPAGQILAPALNGG